VRVRVRAPTRCTSGAEVEFEADGHARLNGSDEGAQFEATLFRHHNLQRARLGALVRGEEGVRRTVARRAGRLMW